MAIASYFVPTLTTSALPKFDACINRKAVRATIIASGFDPGTACLEVRGSLVSGPSSMLTRLAKKHGLGARGKVTVKGQTYTVLSRLPKKDDVCILPAGKEVTETTPEVPEEIELALRRVSDCSGYRFRVLFSTGPSVPPFVRERGIVNIVIGAAPPGAIDCDYVSKLLGINVDRPGYSAFRYGAVLGYGTIVKDDDGEEFAQLVDTTVYLLVPTSSRPHLMLLSAKKGPGLFYRAFSHAWNAYFGKRHEPEATPIGSLKEFEAHMQIRIDMVNRSGVKSLEAIDLQLEQMKQKLHKKFEERRAMLYTKRGIEDFVEELGRNAALEWKALSNNPLLASIKQVNEAIQVETVPIVAEHNGVNYRLGRYAIRFALGTRVSVWNIDSAHPKGVAHPHISPDGIVCFGNVEQSIAEAANNMRPSEVFDIILRWLTEGYDPTLADTKIEEWPVEKANGKLLAPEKTL